MSSIEINGCRIHYQQSGEGPSVVFIHGGFASLYQQLTLPPGDEWEWAWEWDFVPDFHFVWYDRRGCYHSTRPATGDYSLATQAADLERLLDHLRIASAHLIGSSAGGPIAMLFAASRPRRTRSLTLVGTACDLFPSDDRVTAILQAQIELLETEGAEAVFAQRPAGVDISVDVLWEIEEERERGTLDQYLAAQQVREQQAAHIPPAERIQWYATELKNIQAYMEVDTCAYARQIEAPALVLHGEKDRVVPLAWGRRLAQTIPSARLHVVKGGPHGILFRSREARRLAIDFLKQVD